MNGINKPDESADNYKKRRRPVVTCKSYLTLLKFCNSGFCCKGSGELHVFATLEDSLTNDLIHESCEWKRSLGRLVRSVHISCQFIPFSTSALPKGNQWDLIRQPLFHIYWTDCSV